MRFPLWANPTANPTSKTEVRYLSPEGVMAWATSNVTGRYMVPPGGGTLRKLEAQLGIAPGAGKSWTVSYYVNGEEVTATRVKIEGAATKGKWTGELKLKENDTFQIGIVGSGEPANPGPGTEGTAFYTLAEATGEKDFWVAGGGVGNLNTGTLSYNPPFGINSAGWGITEGAARIVVPQKCKLKGVAFDLSGTAGKEKSYTHFARINRSEDVLAAKVEGLVATSALAEGSVQLNPGDTLEAKCSALNEPSARSARYTYVIESEKAGEIFAAGMNAAADSATVANATYPDTWKATWGTSALNRLPRPIGLKFERLYVEASVAPGIGKARSYALTLNGATQALKATIEGAATKANDTTHSFTTDGTVVSMLAEPTLVPEANTGGTHWGFVVIVPQPAEMEAAISGAGTLAGELRNLVSLAASPAGGGAAVAALGSIVNLQLQAQGGGALAGELSPLEAMRAGLTGAGAAAAEVQPLPALGAALVGSAAATAALEVEYVAELQAALAGSGAVAAALEVEYRTNLGGAALVGGGSAAAELEAVIHIPRIELPTFALIEPLATSVVVEGYASGATVETQRSSASIDSNPTTVAEGL